MATVFRKMVNTLEKATPRWVFLSVYGTFAAMKSTYNLLIRYGLMKTAYIWKSVDRSGSPIPWFSYPAVEYLDGLDISGCAVLEFGSGYSTVYWSRRAKSVVAIEDDPEWARRIEPLLGTNARIQQPRSAVDYATTITEADVRFDIIVIDGASRLECAKATLPRLREGGVIILDDADDFPEVATLLRMGDLLQVDFAGFNAINTYTKTTSFFFHRAFHPKVRGTQLPDHSVCHPARVDRHKASVATR